jgi:hypothetical protein
MQRGIGDIEILGDSLRVILAIQPVPMSRQSFLLGRQFARTGH